MQAPHVIALDGHLLLFTFPNGARQSFIMTRPRPWGRPDGQMYHMDTMWDAVFDPQGPEKESKDAVSPE